MNPLNKYFVLVIVVLFMTTGAFFGLWRYEVLKFKQTNADLVSAQSVIADHEKNIQLVERTNHDYEANIDRLNADVKRLRNNPPRCVTVTAPPSLPAQGGQGGGHAPQDGSGRGISSAWLYDYAAECENIRIERNACKDFVDQVWQSHGEHK